MTPRELPAKRGQRRRRLRRDVTGARAAVDPMRTEGLPAAIVLPGPVASAIESPARAAGTPLMSTVAAAVTMGPPTCATGGFPTTIGQVAVSPRRAAGTPPMSTFGLPMATNPPCVVGSPARAAGAASAAGDVDPRTTRERSRERIIPVP